MSKKYNVIVVGGGPAGIAASIAAARNGAKVLLIERYGFLGGMATAGLVNPMYGFFARDEQIIKGIAQEIVDQMAKFPYGTLGHIKRDECYQCDPTRCQRVSHFVPFDAEAFKFAAQLMVKSVSPGKVELLLHSLVIGIHVEKNKITSIVIVNKSGEQTLSGDIFIDCTGDGDIAAFSGAPFEVGRKQNGLTQPPTLMFQVGDVARRENRIKLRLHDFRAENVDWESLPPTGHILFFRLPRPGEYTINATGVTKFNPLDTWELTRAEKTTRQQVISLLKFMREYVPGCKDIKLLSTASQIGIRESRRIIGEYMLTAEDILNAKKFPDGIARGAFPIDIHNPTGEGTSIFQGLECGEYYDIPYRCLLPKEVDNLLVAGRCISSTHEAQGSIRVMATCFATGEAAGTAAALAFSKKQSPEVLSLESLRQQLQEHGVVV
ncbi:MAG: FAD-dependent oxidoreductase [bacterium]|nr:FAD-dependent oxidoreductase [bacterium]